MKLSLNGLWRYEPVERVTITENGVVTSRDDIPPAGQMEIPQNWELGGLHDFNGRVRFTRKFQLSSLPNERMFLTFRGVDYQATVFLNGIELGTHVGYFQSFEYEVTDVLRLENELVVMVESPREDEKTLWPDRKVLIKGVFNHHDARPGGWNPQLGQSKGTGGIWGDVALESRPNAYVQSVKLQTVRLEGDCAFVHANVTVNASRRCYGTLTLDIAGQTYTQRVSLPNGLSHHSLVVKVSNPKLWWTWDLGEPHLYDVKIRLEAEQPHEVVVKTGLRTIQYDKSSGIWYLNGKRLFLRGTNVIPTQWLSNYTHEVISTDIQLLREGNVNAVRVHAHINRREFYEACDAAGILVWQDFPLQWSYLEESDVLSSASAQIQDMVNQFYNHPCICAWCCHNEPSTNANSLDLLLYQIVRGMDGTRYVHQQSDFKEHPYWGWYLDDYTAFREAPMGPLVTEFGAQAFPSKEVMDVITGDEMNWEKLAYHNFQWDETVNIAGLSLEGSMEQVIERSQTYQAELLKFIVESYRRQKYSKVGAVFQFMFMDCWPSVSWSVIDVNRVPKKGYEALRKAYQPVIPLMVLPRKRWLPGRVLSIPIWIVNDTQNVEENATVEVRLTRGENTCVIAEQTVRITADSCLEVESVKYQIPGDAHTGEYELEILIRSPEGTDIASNDYRIVISGPAPNQYDGPSEALNG
ncbi:glycoside hydrolase family 2 protein [Alicyclobacillus pomorum]|uniref:glycoside hydrolase family 2 protein n=1 Tax=Alicyclobacillus pomorum TaxID=204470 RepID=UPI000406E58A|nr:glycoside hydrolase family 2 [Alicyclobacillus pomorum]